MSKNIKGNQKHLTLENRILIEKSLDLGMKLYSIAQTLSKDPTTISKEIKAHRSLLIRNEYNRAINRCIYRKQCTEKNSCLRSVPCKDLCRLCSLNCNKHCNKFVKDECSRLNHSPYVCNGCSDKHGCRYDKYYYRSNIAHSQYRTILSSCREGINLSKEALADLDAIITPGVLKGQSIAHILASHKERIPCSSRTIYSYVEHNQLSIKNLDLPRKVKYKPRKKGKTIRKDPSWKEGRKYDDFIKLGYMTGIVEMDTVVGIVSDSKCLLTLYFRDLHFMIAILLSDKTQSSVTNALNLLESDIGSCTFFNFFPVILTDNGSEFMNPNLIEIGISGLQRTNVYYCNPGASWQKPGVEKNHEYIRYILPKGTSFETLTQEDVSLMMNHINSTARASLNGLTPIELAIRLFGKNTLDKLSIQKINPEDVTLKPQLLKRN